MVKNGPLWFKALNFFLNGPRLSKIIQNSQRWFKMFLNSPWYNIVQIGTKLSKTVQKV